VSVANSGKVFFNEGFESLDVLIVESCFKDVEHLNSFVGCRRAEVKVNDDL
jgi:hypothetical protein